MTEYRELRAEEMNGALLMGFHRKQIVTKCWRKMDGAWTTIDNPFEEDWGEADLARVADGVAETITAGGFAVGAFVDGALKGFAAVAAEPMGSAKQYLELTMIQVSQEQRGTGIGRALFTRAKEFAKSHGAKKLYISAHSSVESQAFYRAMGCVEATEYDRAHAEAEPCDCQMECVL